MFFMPCFYCNVSDAWLFPERFKRLWVSFAGPYFELFVLALATLVWRVTDFGTWPHYLSLLVVATSTIRTLINFNPLIKLDGYYLLSDYLDISNLRRRSFWYVLAASLAGNAGLWSLWSEHGVELLVRPQMWLIPPALSVLAAAQWNRRRLTEAQLAAIRYPAITLLYVSSAGEMS